MMTEQAESFDLEAVGASWSAKLSAENVETKGRGRPAKSSKRSADVAPAPSLSFDGKELRPLVKALGNTACRVGKVTILEDTEVQELSEALAPVLSKYMGESINRFGAEVALVGIALKVSMPRIAEAGERRKREKAERAGDVAEEQPGSSRVGAEIQKEF